MDTTHPGNDSLIDSNNIQQDNNEKNCENNVVNNSENNSKNNGNVKQGSEAVATESPLVPANVFKRFIAFLINYIFFTLITYLFAALITWVLELPYFNINTNNFQQEAMIAAVTQNWWKLVKIFFFNPMTIITLVINPVITVFIFRKWQGTIGMLFMGIKVVRYDTGKPLSILRIIFREFVIRFLATLLTLGIGDLVIFFRKDKRSLTDIWAKTYVVKKNKDTHSINQ